MRRRLLGRGRQCPSRWRCRRICRPLCRLRALSERSVVADELAATGQQSFILAQRLLGNDSRLAHSAMLQTARYLDKAGRADEAVILLRSALSRHPGRGASAEHRHRQTAFELGALLAGLGRDEEAEAHLAGVVATGTADSGEPSQSLTWSAMLWLADVLSRSHRHEEAQGLLEKAFFGLRQRDGADGDTTLCAELALAAAIAGQGDYEAALVIYRHVAETREQRADCDEPELLLARWHLASCLHSAHRDAEARAAAEGLLEAQRRLLGAEHEDVRAVAELVADIDRALAR